MIEKVRVPDLTGMIVEPGVLIADARDIREGHRVELIPCSVRAPRDIIEFRVGLDRPGCPYTSLANTGNCTTFIVRMASIGR